MRDTTTKPHQAAAITVHESPEVVGEVASDDVESSDDAVYVTGTAFHDGLNKNAWGLTEQGAREIAETLVADDFTASHPPLRNGRYDRAIHAGQGAPIGSVVSTEVVTADSAMLREDGYTFKYVAEVKDPAAKAKYQNGLLTGENYGVSVGIYGNPDEAVCSVCREDMTACDHERFQEVEVEADGADDGEVETQIAGPLYDDAVSDHLASVYLPAYDGADADVSASELPAGEATASDGPAAMAALAASFGTRPTDEDESTTTTPTDSEGTPDEAVSSEMCVSMAGQTYVNF